MANPQQQPRPVEENPKEKAAKKANRVEINFWKAFKWCVAFFFVAGVLFFWQQWKTVGLSYPVDGGLFGTLGDFIGGVLGTIIALYTVYLLVRTFQDQTETNASVIETNESIIKANQDVITTNKKLIQQTQLQIFDSRFNSLLALYHSAVEAYIDVDDKSVKGRECFEKYATDFKNSGYQNHTEYMRRSLGAVSRYMELYAKHRKELSVHYRMLYLLSRLTAEEKMREDYRVTYAKSIRGQLSEGELLLLRYNCLSPYGERMRTYVNQFNLLKHLPIMSLLEFSYWREMIGDEDKVNSIDQLAMTLKKLMTKMLDEDGENKNTIVLSSRLRFVIEVNENHEELSVLFSKEKMKKKGGAIKRPVEEGAFDSIVEGELNTFMKEIMLELFVNSNFFQFNGERHDIVTSEIVENNDKRIVIGTKVFRPGSALALAQSQVLPSRDIEILEK